MTVALIDGDIVAYRAATAIQRSIEWEDGEKRTYASPEQAIEVASSLIDEWSSKIKADRTIICMGHARNFRRTLVPSYKSQRPVEKPLVFAKLVEHLRATYECRQIPLLEADDVMGIMGTSVKLDNPIVVTIDKDLAGVPCTLFNPMKDRAPRRISEADANYWWMLQTLMGDRVDGYAGIPGVGPKTAEKILMIPVRSIKNLWRCVTEAYEEKGLTIDDAITTARLARILRREDIDTTEKTISLWHPSPQKRSKLSYA